MFEIWLHQADDNHNQYNIKRLSQVFFPKCQNPKAFRNVMTACFEVACFGQNQPPLSYM